MADCRPWRARSVPVALAGVVAVVALSMAAAGLSGRASASTAPTTLLDTVTVNSASTKLVHGRFALRPGTKYTLVVSGTETVVATDGSFTETKDALFCFSATKPVGCDPTGLPGDQTGRSADLFITSGLEGPSNPLANIDRFDQPPTSADYNSSHVYTVAFYPPQLGTLVAGGFPAAVGDNPHQPRSGSWTIKIYGPGGVNAINCSVVVTGLLNQTPDHSAVLRKGDTVAVELHIGDRLCPGDLIIVRFANTLTVHLKNKGGQTVFEEGKYLVEPPEQGSQPILIEDGQLLGDLLKNFQGFIYDTPVDRTKGDVVGPGSGGGLGSAVAGQATVLAVSYNSKSRVATTKVRRAIALVQLRRHGRSYGPALEVRAGERWTVGVHGVIAKNLATAIPNAVVLRSGPIVAAFPGRISLATLRRSRCIRTEVVSSRKAKGIELIRIGRRASYGGFVLVFKGPARLIACVTPLRGRPGITAATTLTAIVKWRGGAPRTRRIALVP